MPKPAPRQDASAWPKSVSRAIPLVVDQHLLGADVAVVDPRLVGRLEGVRHVDHQGRRGPGPQPALGLKERPQGPPVDELRHDDVPTRGLDDLERRDHVGVPEGGHRSQRRQDPLAQLGVVGELAREHLDRHRADLAGGGPLVERPDRPAAQLLADLDLGLRLGRLRRGQGSRQLVQVGGDRQVRRPVHVVGDRQVVRDREAGRPVQVVGDREPAGLVQVAGDRQLVQVGAPQVAGDQLGRQPGRDRPDRGHDVGEVGRADQGAFSMRVSVHWGTSPAWADAPSHSSRVTVSTGPWALARLRSRNGFPSRRRSTAPRSVSASGIRMSSVLAVRRRITPATAVLNVMPWGGGGRLASRCCSSKAPTSPVNGGAPQSAS